MPDIALVVPLDGDCLRLVDQYRPVLGQRTWEFPSGDVEPRRDADPAAAAARELREETGLTAATLTPLGVLTTMPSTWTQRCSVFLATGLAAGAASPDLAEGDLRSAWFTRAEVESMIGDGTLADAKSVAAYALLRLHAE